MSELDITKYLKWIEEGKSFSHIREDLEKNGIHPNDVKSMLAELDYQVWSEKQKGINKSQGLQWIIAGTMLTIASLLVMLLGFLPMMFFAFGGLGSGLGMVLWGKKLRTQQPGAQKKLSKKASFKNRTA